MEFFLSILGLNKFFFTEEFVQKGTIHGTLFKDKSQIKTKSGSYNVDSSAKLYIKIPNIHDMVYKI